MPERARLELLSGPPSGKAVARMTSKGPSPVDPEPAAPTSSRRQLIGTLGAAGLAGAAAVALARPAAAAPPSSPTPEDRDVLALAMQVELTAAALYQVAIDAGLDAETADLANTFRANHTAYADKIAGRAGLSANTRNQDLFDELESAFDTSDTVAFATVANELENTLAETHTGLLTGYVSVDARTLTASIVVVEARMATVLADVAGIADDLDDLFEPDSEPLSVGGDA